MKGTEKIIAHIQADAKAQADAILAQAEQQCAEIRRDYEIKAKDAYAEKIRLGVKSNQDKLDSVERLTRMESRKAILALKQEMVSAGFDKAVEELIALCLQSLPLRPPPPAMKRSCSTRAIRPR